MLAVAKPDKAKWLIPILANDFFNKLKSNNQDYISKLSNWTSQYARASYDQGSMKPYRLATATTNFNYHIKQIIGKKTKLRRRHARMQLVIELYMWHARMIHTYIT